MLIALIRAVRQFRRNRRATAGLEFALVLPVLLMIWAGMSEMAHAIDEWRKLTLFARTVSDLTSQGDSENPFDTVLMTDIFNSSAKVMRPFDATAVKIVVSAMGVDLLKDPLHPSVCSSVANANGTARIVGKASDLALPPGYTTTGMRYMFAEVSIAYTPMIGSALIKLLPGIRNPIILSASFPWPARGGRAYGSNTYTEIVLTDATSKPCDTTYNANGT